MELNEKQNSSWSELPEVLTPGDLIRFRILPLGKHAVYALFHRHDFPAIRHGNKLFVTRDSLRQWLESGRRF